ncbi:MAG: hypothetical protein K0S04_515 [Herbinix sp.]|jgi:hypothetical protein|nr:hypothetical protein [Herbinix sp.]
MKKKTILYIVTLILVVLVLSISVYNFTHTEKGTAIFEIYDAINDAAIENANIIIMEEEKVFKADSEGRALVQLESRPNTPKKFMGYTVMVITDGYLPMIVYNVGFYPADKPETAVKYRISLKKPEVFSNVSYTTEVLPTSNTAMAGIIEYYKNLIK